jgi:hypothetical protein
MLQKGAWLMPVIHEIQMVQMGEVDTRQYTVRQPPQLGSKKNKNSKQPTGGSLYVIWVFLLLILCANRKNKFYSIAAKGSYWYVII